jgi:signal transduction histidine kinase
MMAKSGNQHHYTLRISPLRNRHNELTGRLLVLHDITEQRQAAEKIRTQYEALQKTHKELAVAWEKADEASRLKSEFLATMSHELRTPLNSIVGYTDLLRQPGLIGDLNERQLDYLQRIIANAERLLSLINNLLDLSRIEAGRLDLVYRPFSPAKLLEDVRVQLEGLAQEKGLTLATTVDSALPTALLGDTECLEQILTNLIGNAVKFTKRGSVEVCLSKSGSAYWNIKVTDTGIGIPAPAFEYIFDEFRRVSTNTQDENSGTGLGLAIVRKLVLAMGGTVDVQSTVGEGSTFTVKLPIKVPEGDADA